MYTIKSVKFFDTLDGGGFNCTLYKDNKKVAYVYDEGCGGSLYYDCLNGWDFGSYTFDEVIYNLIDEHRQKKEEKKGILVKREFGYAILQWRVTIPTMLKKYSNGLEAIQKGYDKAIQAGEEVLNKEYLSSIGVNV
tara:strand:- start:2189 stop:2596 length:408 start_codon:yes stop_codon:yes gene_type:complete